MIILFSVYFVLLDELITSCAQIRIGPSNLGYYGIFSSLVNHVIIEKDIRLFYGITGLLSRSAKIGIDARFTGHELHHKLSYTLYLSSSGDRTDRYIPRFNEIIETNKINYLCLCLLDSIIVGSLYLFLDY